jgi:hypothetical protein
LSDPYKFYYTPKNFFVKYAGGKGQFFSGMFLCFKVKILGGVVVFKKWKKNNRKNPPAISF